MNFWIQEITKNIFEQQPINFLSLCLVVNISRTGHQITAYLLQHILRCEFTEIPDYVSWLLTYKKGFLMNRNPVLKLACRRNIRKCRNTEFLEKLCRSRPLQVLVVQRVCVLRRQSFRFFQHTLHYLSASSFVAPFHDRNI